MTKRGGALVCLLEYMFEAMCIGVRIRVLPATLEPVSENKHTIDTDRSECNF